MPLHFKEVIYLGRSMEEYVAMFALKETDLDKRILDTASGPSSFNCEMKAGSRRVTSVDPLYKWGRTEAERMIKAPFDDIFEQVSENIDGFSWTERMTVEEMKKTRLSIVDTFLDDFKKGKRENRYVEGQLPTLPFADGEFDLALCSYLLFTYWDLLSYEFHYTSIKEMLRVAHEARIFPVHDFTARRSPYLNPIETTLKEEGFRVFIERVGYEPLRGVNEMMRIVRDS